MTAAPLLHQCQAAGLALHLDGGDIVVRGPAEARARLLPAIREHKPALVSLLAAPSPLTPADLEDIEEAIVERAAIREFGGDESREVAERHARVAMRLYRALVHMPAGHPGEPKWVVLLLPGVETLSQARAAAEWRFGAERVVEVRP